MPKADYTVLRRIGQGAQGTVYEAVHKTTNMTYAIKKIDVSHLSEKEKQSALQEVRVLATLQQCPNPYVMGYVESFVDSEEEMLCLVLEWSSEGTLEDRFESLVESNKQNQQHGGQAGHPPLPPLLPPPLTEQEVWRVFLSIALALDHIHGLRILHRDVKMANVFLHSSAAHSSDAVAISPPRQQKGGAEGGAQPSIGGETAIGAGDGGGAVVVIANQRGPIPKNKRKTLVDRVQLGDFGVSTILADKSNAKTMVGTPYYLSPELCMGRPYTAKTDVWSLGVMVFSMLYNRMPFEANNYAALILRIIQTSSVVMPPPASSSSVGGVGGGDNGHNGSSSGNGAMASSSSASSSYAPILSKLCEWMLSKKEVNRPSARDIIAHPACLAKALDLGLVVPQEVLEDQKIMGAMLARAGRLRIPAKPSLISTTRFPTAAAAKAKKVVTANTQTAAQHDSAADVGSHAETDGKKPPQQKVGGGGDPQTRQAALIAAAQASNAEQRQLLTKAGNAIPLRKVVTGPRAKSGVAEVGDKNTDTSDPAAAEQHKFDRCVDVAFTKGCFGVPPPLPAPIARPVTRGVAASNIPNNSGADSSATAAPAQPVVIPAPQQPHNSAVNRVANVRKERGGAVALNGGVRPVTTNKAENGGCSGRIQPPSTTMGDDFSRFGFKPKQNNKHQHAPSAKLFSVAGNRGENTGGTRSGAETNDASLGSPTAGKASSSSLLKASAKEIDEVRHLDDDATSNDGDSNSSSSEEDGDGADDKRRTTPAAVVFRVDSATWRRGGGQQPVVVDESVIQAYLNGTYGNQPSEAANGAARSETASQRAVVAGGNSSSSRGTSPNPPLTTLPSSSHHQQDHHRQNNSGDHDAHATSAAEIEMSATAYGRVRFSTPRDLGIYLEQHRLGVFANDDDAPTADDNRDDVIEEEDHVVCDDDEENESDSSHQNGNDGQNEPSAGNAGDVNTKSYRNPIFFTPGGAYNIGARYYYYNKDDGDAYDDVPLNPSEDLVGQGIVISAVATSSSSSPPPALDSRSARQQSEKDEEGEEEDAQDNREDAMGSAFTAAGSVTWRVEGDGEAEEEEDGSNAISSSQTASPIARLAQQQQQHIVAGGVRNGGSVAEKKTVGAVMKGTAGQSGSSSSNPPVVIPAATVFAGRLPPRPSSAGCRPLTQSGSGGGSGCGGASASRGGPLSGRLPTSSSVPQKGKGNVGLGNVANPANRVAGDANNKANAIMPLPSTNTSVLKDTLASTCSSVLSTHVPIPIEELTAGGVSVWGSEGGDKTRSAVVSTRTAVPSIELNLTSSGAVVSRGRGVADNMVTDLNATNSTVVVLPDTRQKWGAGQQQRVSNKNWSIASVASVATTIEPPPSEGAATGKGLKGKEGIGGKIVQKKTGGGMVPPSSSSSRSPPSSSNNDAPDPVVGSNASNAGNGNSQLLALLHSLKKEGDAVSGPRVFAAVLDAVRLSAAGQGPLLSTVYSGKEASQIYMAKTFGICDERRQGLLMHIAFRCLFIEGQLSSSSATKPSPVDEQ